MCDAPDNLSLCEQVTCMSFVHMDSGLKSVSVSVDLCYTEKVLHGESNKGPASPRTTKATAQSKPPTNQPSHTQTANEKHGESVITRH